MIPLAEMQIIQIDITNACMLDADDILLEDFIEAHLRAHLTVATVAFTSTNQYQINSAGDVIGGQHMPEQPPRQRAGNFQEVALGYTPEMAAAEAGRCLQCKTPGCRQGCPVEINIPAFIARLAAGDIDGAYGVIRQTNSLPAVCGRVCPQEHQCEGSCVLGKKGEPVAIGRLERFVADTYLAKSACETVTGAPACPMGRVI